MINIPISNQIPRERDVSFDLGILKELMGISDSILADIIFETEEEVKRVYNQKNRDIDINFLFKLYFFANEHWLKNSAASETDETLLDKVRCTRRLRDACKREIARRTMEKN